MIAVVKNPVLETARKEFRRVMTLCKESWK